MSECTREEGREGGSEEGREEGRKEGRKGGSEGALCAVCGLPMQTFADQHPERRKLQPMSSKCRDEGRKAPTLDAD